MSTAPGENRTPAVSHAAIYRKLLSGRNAGPEGPWFRLLILEPGHYDDPIRCALVNRPLYEASQAYTALSYAWGTGHPQEKIYIGLWPDPFYVSRHLHNALRRLRVATERTTIWVDAICINQIDFVERANQVAIMHEVFGNAAQVAIWLGEPTIRRSPHPEPWELSELESYCGRLWVVQEITFASRCPCVLVGESRRSMAAIVETWPSGLYTGRGKGRFFMLFRNWQQQVETNQATRPLLSRLRETFELQCKEPHDKIYALLHLIPQSESKDLFPDYRMSLRALYETIVWRLLRSPGWHIQDFHDLYASLFGRYHQTIVLAPTESIRKRAGTLELVEDGHGIYALLTQSYARWQGMILQLHLADVYVARNFHSAQVRQVLALANKVPMIDLIGRLLHEIQPFSEFYYAYAAKTRTQLVDYNVKDVPHQVRCRGFRADHSVFGFFLDMDADYFPRSMDKLVVFTRYGGVSCVVSGNELLGYCYIPRSLALEAVAQGMQPEDVSIDIPLALPTYRR